MTRALALLPLLLACADPKGSPPIIYADDGLGGDEGAPYPDDSGTTDGSVDGGGDTDTAAPDDTAPPTPAPPARVILFIGDGMGFEHVKGGGQYRTGVAGSLTMETLPVQARIRTASYSGVTDSAAAATVMAAGAKTWNGRLGLDADGLAVQSLVDLAELHGKATGIVTTDKLYGATPSAFLVHDEDRYDAATIAADEVANLPMVALGGGRDVLLPLLDPATTQILQSRTELLALVPDARPIVGVFAPVEVPFVADTADTSDSPALAEMTVTALGLLDADPDGFFLMVEGARIDHASHGNNTDFVHAETAAFDEAIEAALAWAADKENVTIVVTADHECGGMTILGDSPAGEPAPTGWRWGKHTNADVPLFGVGEALAPLDGQRVDQLYVHAALESALLSTPFVEPTVPRLVDGWTQDLPDPLLVQPWETDFGLGFNQLDTLRVDADSRGLWLGLDGVYEFDGNNAVFVLVDADFGAGTGWGSAGLARTDLSLGLDASLTALSLDIGVDGLGFDLAMGSVGATEIGYIDINADAGMRGFAGPWGTPDNYGWISMVSNFDDGNLARFGDAAADAGPTGTTENGFELLLPWERLYPDGMPAEGLSLAFAVVLTNADGTYNSNQRFPAGDTATGTGSGAIPIDAVVRIDVDAAGERVGEVTLSP